MSELVDATEIERIVGVARHASEHYGRAVSTERTVYILHSHACKDSGRDLRECSFSQALDNGIDDLIPWGAWRGLQDRPVQLEIFHGYLLPTFAAVKAALGQPIEGSQQ